MRVGFLMAALVVSGLAGAENLHDPAKGEEEIQPDGMVMDDAFSVQKNAGEVSLNVLLNDNIDPDAPAGYFTVSVNQQPTTRQGTARTSEDGTAILFTPETGFVGATGLRYNLYRATGERIGVGIVSIDVIGNPDEALVANPDTFTYFRGDGPMVLPVLENDTGSNMFAVDLSHPFNADLSLFTGESIDLQFSSVNLVIIPAAGDQRTGPATFEYILRANDGSGAESQPATVTVNIMNGRSLPDPVAPNASDDVIAIQARLEANDLAPRHLPHAALLDNDEGDGIFFDFFSVNNQTVNGIEDISSLAASGDGATARLGFLPEVGFVGATTFQYDIRNSTASSTDRSTATATLHVIDIVDDTFVSEGGVQSLDILANDDSADAPVVFDLALVTQPNQGGMAAAPTGASISYTPPDTPFVEEQFRYTLPYAHGFIGSAVVTVQSGGVGIVAVNDEFEVLEDSFDNEFMVLENDQLGPNPPYSITIAAQPEHGVVEVVNVPEEGMTDRSFIFYDPEPDFFGRDAFRYSVSDRSFDSDDALITVDVTNTNDPPFAEADIFQVFISSAANMLDVLANDSNEPDPPGTETLMVTGFDQLPNQGGSVTANGTSVSYTPDPEFAGVETFVYILEDGGDQDDIGIVSVQVVPDNGGGDNLPPEAHDDFFGPRDALEEGGNRFLLDVLFNDSDPDGDPLFIASVTNEDPPNVATVEFVENDAAGEPPFLIEANVDEDFDGILTFDYTIIDGRGGEDTATVTLNRLEDVISPCDADPGLTEQDATFETLFGMLPETFNEGLGAEATLALYLDALGCSGKGLNLQQTAAEIAYTVNFLRTHNEVATDDIAGVRDYLAAIMSVGAVAQSEIAAALADAGPAIQLEAVYEIVECDSGECMPRAIDGITIFQKYAVFPPGHKTADEPFSGQGDLDGDGTSNAAELQNVLDAGGNIEDFVTAARDATTDGTTDPEPPGDTGCFGEPAAATPRPATDYALFGLAVAILIATNRRRRQEAPGPIAQTIIPNSGNLTP